MGYRSDVKAVFYTKGDDFPVLKLWLEENFPIKKFKDSIRWFNTQEYKGMAFVDNGVKWYSDYPEIMAFNAAVEKFVDMFCDDPDIQHDFCYEFIRIGEEYDDIEVRREGEYAYVIEVEQRIVMEV